MPKLVSAVKIRPKGPGFEARPCVNGKQVSIYRATFAEVQNELAKFQLGKRISRVSKDITLKEYLTHWLQHEELCVRSGERKYNTYKTRKDTLEKHVIPDLGSIHLSELNIRIVKMHFDDLTRKAIKQHGLPVGSRSRQLAFEALRAAISTAVDDGYLESNPLFAPSGRKKGPKPGHKSAEKQFLTVDQAKALLTSCAKGSKMLYTLVYTALHTGMRSGELRALKRARIDLNARTINVTGSASEAIDGGYEEVYPKTSAGYRKITIGQDLVDVLTPYLADMPIDALVFPNADGGIMDRSNFMNRAYRPAVQDAGLDIDFHALRHTHVALLIAANVSMKKIQVRLGHASIKITMDTYGHLLPGDDIQTAEKLDGTFG